MRGGHHGRSALVQDQEGVAGVLAAAESDSPHLGGGGEDGLFLRRQVGRLLCAQFLHEFAVVAVIEDGGCGGRRGERDKCREHNLHNPALHIPSQRLLPCGILPTVCRMPSSTVLTCEDRP